MNVPATGNATHPAATSPGPEDTRSAPTQVEPGLTCFTANLYEYLATELPDARGDLARSIRLAVRTDLPGGELAFSHHIGKLDALPDGSCLRYATSETMSGALVGIADELAGHRRVIVVVDACRLPWSPVHGSPDSAPHWLLVDDRQAGLWHVRDSFAGLLPTGEQRPFHGWISTTHLTEALTLPPAWTPIQRLRCRYAFGHPVPPPERANPQWLRRVPRIRTHAEPPGNWITDDDDVLRFLSEYFIAQGAHAAEHLDDLWAAAQHRVFAHRWLAEHDDLDEPERDQIELGCELWRKLPSALHFAVESAARGRPRQALISTTFEYLRSVEDAIRTIQLAYRRKP